MSNKTIQYNLRITDELRQRLKQSAEKHNRSMNADIVSRIEQTFFVEKVDAETSKFLQTQKDWTKTQVRLPPDLHPLVKQYAKNNNLSLNSAILDLINKGLNPATKIVDRDGVEVDTMQVVQSIENALQILAQRAHANKQ